MDHTVLLFTGHLLDRIDRVSARFPYRLINEVRRIIESELSHLTEQERRPQMAVSSLGAGGDIIFAGEIVRRKIPLHIFLPFEPDKFIADSVKYVKDDPDEDHGEWVDKFHHMIAAATTVTVTPLVDGDLDPFASCNRFMLNYALEQSNFRPERILALALVDHQSEIKSGGSADFVNRIEAAGIAVKKVWPTRSNRLYR